MSIKIYGCNIVECENYTPYGVVEKEMNYFWVGVMPDNHTDFMEIYKNRQDLE